MKSINWIVLIILIGLFAFALWFTSCAMNVTPEDQIKQNANTIEVGFRFATRESLSLTKHRYPGNEQLVKDSWLQLGGQFVEAQSQTDLDANAAAGLVVLFVRSLNVKLDFLSTIPSVNVPEVITDAGQILAGFLRKATVTGEIRIYLMSAAKGIGEGIKQFEEML